MRSARGFDDAYVSLFVVAERVAARILGDRDAAEDVAAEAIARALASWRRVHRHPERWLVRTTTRLSLEKGRRPAGGDPAAAAGGYDFDAAANLAAAGNFAAADDLDAGQGAALRQGDGLRRADVLQALGRLPRRRAQAIALRYLVGLGDNEIAEAMGVRVGKVGGELQRGLDLLRRRLPAAHADTGDGADADRRDETHADPPGGAEGDAPGGADGDGDDGVEGDGPRPGNGDEHEQEQQQEQEVGG